MGRILVGTCSWTDPTLIESGRFYPATVRTAAERLAYYAAHFPIVEVDSTYYGMPSERNSTLWVERTPPDFIFDIKAYRLFTRHPTPPASMPKDLLVRLPRDLAESKNLYWDDVPAELQQVFWLRFRQALEPLRRAGKLGVVLFQFPEWFVRSHRSLEHLELVRERMDGFRIAVEFRHRSWLDPNHADETLGFLRDRGLSFVSVDEPQGFKSSVPPVLAATTDTAIVRFHGRNRENWEKRGITAAERFRYLYSEDELAEWAEQLAPLAHELPETHALMNNCYADYGIRNARQLAAMIRAKGQAEVEVPVAAGLGSGEEGQLPLLGS